MEIKKGKPGRKDQYDLSFKRKVCEELISGKYTRGEINQKYQIPGQGTISRWLKWYLAEQENLSLVSMEHLQKNNQQSEEEEKSLKELQAELKAAKAKITTLETMIDIAEEQFNIEIRKKSGTKPSSE